jgi:hypothetical protein
MWDIPASPIKSDREYEKRVHKGYWCSCYDKKIGDKTIRMVLKASKNPGNLNTNDTNVYLVGPNGNRLDN